MVLREGCCQSLETGESEEARAKGQLCEEVALDKHADAIHDAVIKLHVSDN